MRTYTYDATGNRETQTTSRGGFVEETRHYECDANDRLTTETVTDSGGPREIVYAYDADGNLLSKNDPAPGAGLTEYTWDSRDRLIGQTGGPDGPVSFLYDSDGNRVEKTVCTGPTAKTTRFLIDAANGTGYTQVRREKTATGEAPPPASFLETTRYVIGDDVLARVRSDLPIAPGVPTLSQYHYDGLGTTRALSGPSGDATDATSYYGFGETLASAGDTPDTLLVTGEHYDPNLGFYHLRARYYDPASGRFASLDPFVGDSMTPMSLHKYLYANGMTTRTIDPSGMMSLVELVVTEGIKAGLILFATVYGTDILVGAFLLQYIPRWLLDNPRKPDGVSFTFGGQASGGKNGLAGSVIYGLEFNLWFPWTPGSSGHAELLSYFDIGVGASLGPANGFSATLGASPGFSWVQTKSADYVGSNAFISISGHQKSLNAKTFRILGAMIADVLVDAATWPILAAAPLDVGNMGSYLRAMLQEQRDMKESLTKVLDGQASRGLSMTASLTGTSFNISLNGPSIAYRPGTSSSSVTVGWVGTARTKDVWNSISTILD